MANRYQQSSNFSGVTRFTRTPMVDVEFSSMVNDPTRYVPFNAGDIVPIDHFEVLPHSTYEIDLEYICRQLSASLRPTMGTLTFDIFCFYVPNRIVNDSWKNVTGENTSGVWTAPEVSLCPLTNKSSGSTIIPVGSVADYYGLPTQLPIPNVVLEQMNDLPYCGYVSIYNNYFRDQNYQPPIPCSTLNVHKGFLLEVGTSNTLIPAGVAANTPADGGYESGGTIVKALYGEGSKAPVSGMPVIPNLTRFSILDKPLKANKFHDPFTSVLPTPQKGPDVYVGLSEIAPIIFDTTSSDIINFPSGNPLQLYSSNAELLPGSSYSLKLGATEFTGGTVQVDPNSEAYGGTNVDGHNIVAFADLSEATGVNINDLRTAVATQHVYELLARGGSRYWSFLKSFFGVETVNPFPDIPTQIGHLRRDMDLYQVAQTSSSVEGGTPQGNLTAFGYTATGGSLFTKTFLEHGYVHILGVVRHRPIYSSYTSPDKFRRNTLDFYLPQFANIGEQPIRLATLNPFREDSMELAIGYNEAFWEYRYSPNTVVGALRTGLQESLDVWHYGEFFDGDFTHVNGEWLVSDSQEILDRTLAVTSELAPQFICQFNFRIKKQLPMPVYSVPGLDTI